MDYKEIKECKQRLDEINDELNNIVENAKSENRELTDEEQVKLDELSNEKEDLIVIASDLLSKIEDVVDKIDEIQDTQDTAEPVEEKPTEEMNKGRKQIDKNKINKQTRLMTNTEKTSLLTMIRKSAEGVAFNDTENMIIETGRKEMKEAGISSVGAIVLPSKRALTATTANTGLETVQTDIQDIITPAWARQALASANATFMSNMQGNIQFPLMSKTNVSWEAETAPAPNGQPTFDAVTLMPKRLTCYVDISKQLLIQSNSSNLESIVAGQIVKAVSDKLEATLLGDGAGSATQPAGIFNIFTPVTLTPTWEELVDLEGTLEANDITGNKKIILNPANKVALKSTRKDPGSAVMLMVDNEVNGYEAITTSNSFGLAFGDFSKYIVASFGNTDLVVDPYSQAANGCIRLVVNTYWDAAALWKAGMAGQLAPIVTASV